ncbi:MAG: P-type conjugative transfer protein TrbJ [Vicinamibacterales bacterium]
MSVKHRRIRTAFLAASVLATLSMAPASAQIVFDPSNYTQNMLQAARALQQVTNQITSLQNQAQMLINQARNLASLPQSSLSQIQQSIQRTQQLLGEAQRIAYDVGQIDHAFSTTYGAASTTTTDQALIDGARERWRNSLAGLQDAMKVHAGVVANIDTNRVEMSSLVTASQAATGSLQATQAGNQLIALQTQQIADLTGAVAAQGRAQNLEAAQRTAAQEQAREQFRRFLAPGAGYRPTTVRMFQ